MTSSKSETPPVRISADQDHPDYSPQCELYDAYLDGRRESFAITVDTEAGTIERYKTTRNGTPVLDPDNHSIKTEVVRGVVELRPAKP